MSGRVRAWIGLGANTGESLATVRAAIDALAELPDTVFVRRSRFYRTPAWGPIAQPDFINAVALVETRLAPSALLDGLLGIERAFGRVRAERWGPRSLDLDLLLYGDAQIDEPGLHVPHPHLHQRVFVLVPLLDTDPDAVIPGRGSAREALAALASDRIEVVG